MGKHLPSTCPTPSCPGTQQLTCHRRTSNQSNHPTPAPATPHAPLPSPTHPNSQHVQRSCRATPTHHHAVQNPRSPFPSIHLCRYLDSLRYLACSCPRLTRARRICNAPETRPLQRATDTLTTAQPKPARTGKRAEPSSCSEPSSCRRLRAGQVCRAAGVLRRHGGCQGARAQIERGGKV